MSELQINENGHDVDHRNKEVKFYSNECGLFSSKHKSQSSYTLCWFVGLLFRLHLRTNSLEIQD